MLRFQLTKLSVDKLLSIAYALPCELRVSLPLVALRRQRIKLAKFGEFSFIKLKK